ncbi:c6 zinc finger domain containing protein [Niveomyces insectorum RCEF 264]|uniref:C6 zinc finger domain containing protein n=1 Tax=Niveomyces insectorum RCEF 264 TaxID=1081102 RepID=A0A167Z076_9HYPO|nr:c6 zinc finger domain containing protein [Niveomyces insectorum RCEF 264]
MFLFHASLVIVLAILGDPSSPQMPRWQADMDTVRTILKGILGNHLARRCADILNLILPSDAPANLGPAWGAGDHLDMDVVDFSMWPDDAGDMWGSFVWPYPGEGI